MAQFSERYLRTGGDPRTLPDYVALRDEISKLTHPARPDVNWKQVSTLSLALFEHNGVELQTAAWYTLARTHLAGCEGLNEGLALIAAMAGHQWVQMWPQQTHARTEILIKLSQRLQKVWRTLSLTHNDLPALYQSEALLNSLNDILNRQQLKQVCQLDTLCRQIQQTLTRLENSTPQQELAADAVLPPQALTKPQMAGSDDTSGPMVCVIRPEPEVHVEVARQAAPPVKKWPAFMAGMMAAWLLGGAILWGVNSATETDPAQQALQQTLSPLPQALNADQIRKLQRSEHLNQLEETWITQAAQRLDALAALPPDWQQQYAARLISQARHLWPNSSAALRLQNDWQQKAAVNPLSDSALNGWHQGMQKMQALSDRLDGLDGQRGKYITVSELKSVVFAMMNSFRQAVPVEEQLRQLSDTAPDQLPSPAMLKEAELHLNALNAYLSEQRPMAEAVSL